MGSLCILSAVLLFTLILDIKAQCPERCQCYGSTVRCMFLQLETIPRIPRSTTVL